MDKIGRIQELTKILNEHRHKYYNLNSPTITDKEYDELVDQLSSLENETGYSLANSPTKTVGYEVISKLQKRTHPTPLKSLNKTKSIDELNKWGKNKDVLLMFKADGLTVEVNYDNGQFVGGYTRGNGEIGEDISHNCKVFKNLPMSIPFKGKLRVVGEAIIHTNDFNKINSKLSEEEKYATPRNLCSGSVRQLNSEVCAKRNIYFYAFGILECSETLSDSKYENFKWIGKQGFYTIGNMKISEKISENDIRIMIETAEEMSVPIDGLVASFDSVNYSNSLPETSHHPNHSMAYKLEDEYAESILRDVEWNTTRLGQINPVAIFDTVILDNTEVSRASLFNLTFIKEMGLNLLNRIKVSKRNMIIPYIEENLDKQVGNYIPIPIPEVCPSCGEKTSIVNTGTADFLMCKNKRCPAQLLDRFVHFVSRDAMNIEGMSDATIQKFIDKGFLKTFDDIYKLDQYKNEIVNMEGFGIKSYNKLMDVINKSRKVKLNQFIYALGIPNIGKSGAKILSKAFNYNWIEFEKALSNRFNFSILEDFGYITNDSLHKWYADVDERKLWINLLDEVDFVKEEKKETELMSLEKMTFVVTGSVETFKNRKELEALISELGGKLSGSVSSKTDFLINNDVTSNSGKNKKAKQLDVKIISEAEFNEMIGRSG